MSSAMSGLMSKGVIFDIKRFALHDGEGLRTTLFLKGCPLTCPWCQNPEGLSSRIELYWHATKCMLCGECVAKCPQGALSFGGSQSAGTLLATQNQRVIGNSADLETQTIHIDKKLCTQCGVCIQACPTNALAFDGYTVEAGDVVETLLRDKSFFDSSGGGVTLSGGEPLVQADFAYDVVHGCKAAGVSVTMETSLGVPHKVLEPFAHMVDCFFVDQKIADPDEHQRLLGVSQQLVRGNLEYLLQVGARVIIRIPLIPEYTATEENIRGLGTYIASLVGCNQSAPQSAPNTPKSRTAPSHFASPQPTANPQNSHKASATIPKSLVVPSQLSPPQVELLNFNPLAEQKFRTFQKPWPFTQKAKQLSAEEVKQYAELLRTSGLTDIIY